MKTGMKDHRALLQEARNHVKEQRFDEAIELFESVLKENPEVAAAYLGIGDIYMRKGNLDEAENYFNGALHVAKKSAPALAMLASVAEKRGDAKRALKLNMDAIEENPEGLRPRMAISRLHLRSKRFADAAIQLREALRYNPQSTAAGLMLARVLQRQGKTDEALTSLSQSVQVGEPGSAEAHLLQGQILLRQGKYLEAAEVLGQCISAKPGNVKAYAYRGQALMEAGHYLEAITVLEEALERNPKSLAAKMHLARCYVDNGDHDKARKLLTRLTFGNRRLGTVHMLLGRLFAAQGHFRQAIEEFEAWLLHAPKLVEERPELLEIANRHGSSQDRVQAYERAVEAMARHVEPSPRA